MSFLPVDEKIEQAPSQFLKLDEGEHRFRALDSAIVGWLAWDETGDKPKPMRIRAEGESFDADKINPDRPPKRFWAFPVYNVTLGKIQTLEITQKTIMKDLLSYTKDEDFGDPQGYDLVISRVGKTLADTEYSTIAKPPKPLDAKIILEFKQMKSDGTYDINRLFDGEFPVSDKKAVQTIPDGKDDPLDLGSIPL